jgi:hypothetical protein
MPTITNIFSLARSIVDADATSLIDSRLLLEVNGAYEEVISDLITFLSINKKFGDSNYSSLSVDTRTLVASTREVELDETFLSFIRVEVKDINGIWQKLKSINEEDITVALPEYQKDAGLPTEYAIRENFLILYPAPSASKTILTNGLNIYSQKTADIFTSAQLATGTKIPGFASPYHYLLSYKAVLTYALSYKKDRVPFIMSKIAELQRKMFNFYANRNQDKKSRMIPAQQDNR